MNSLKLTGLLLSIFFLLDNAEAGKGNCTIFTSCNPCLKGLKNNVTIDCFWCSSTEECIEKDGLLPKGCKSVDWRYFDNCTVPGYVWVIVFPVLGFVILVAISCCFYCCCCKCKSGGRGSNNEEAKFHRKRLELKQKHAERRAERREKTDEIRKKYGLDKSDSTSSRYQQFENDPEV
ncbi:pituitary tumor-transforming gene 1 protein-interacting protein-like [Dendronephthya gigantea]|uniref:pituitary tumor-transforming gene 1 protein-interacting protein-like n=1 Tax=Dendronephthya gigantea TaxID=151771 RepID=UPI001068E790|nr:pituitary tumor-transforming gene 1 protein-interacting protein-like [Dendronephthya gigantea]